MAFTTATAVGTVVGTVVEPTAVLPAYPWNPPWQITRPGQEKVESYDYWMNGINTGVLYLREPRHQCAFFLGSRDFARGGTATGTVHTTAIS